MTPNCRPPSRKLLNARSQGRAAIPAKAGPSSSVLSKGIALRRFHRLLSAAAALGALCALPSATRGASTQAAAAPMICAFASVPKGMFVANDTVAAYDHCPNPTPQMHRNIWLLLAPASISVGQHASICNFLTASIPANYTFGGAHYDNTHCTFLLDTSGFPKNYGVLTRIR